MLQLISWGRSHCFTLCCTLSPSGNPTDLGPGWKLSSTKLTLFCESERQGEHQCAAVRHTALPGASWDGAGRESPPLHPQEPERSPQRCCLARAAPCDAVAGSRFGAGWLLTTAQMRFVGQVQRSAPPGAGSPLRAATQICLFSVSQEHPRAGTVSRLVPVLKAGPWGTLAASRSGKARERRACEEPPGKQKAPQTQALC